MKKLVIILSACFGALQATAQTDNDAMMKNWQAYMTPGDMHKLMASADGKWNEEVSMWMAPGQPPTVSKSTAENKMILGGRYQQSVSKGDFGGMPFEGMSTMGYDNLKKVFVSSWVDNMGTGIMYMEGPYDAATKTITLRGKEVDPMSGKEMEMRETMTFTDANHQVIAMFSVTDGKEMKNMEIKLTRAK